MAFSYNFRYIETSAKLNRGINDLFSTLTASILSQHLKDISNANDIACAISSDEQGVIMRSGTCYSTFLNMVYSSNAICVAGALIAKDPPNKFSS